MKPFLVILLSCFLPFFLSPTYAAGEFRADYDVEYSVAPSGITTVTNVISLTNKLTNLYPKEYTVLIDSTNIQNIIAYDKKGSIIPKVTRNDGKTEITVVFNERAIGINNSLTFTLRYDNNDIAQHEGNIWEVYIPGIADDPDLGRYRVSLYVPPSFGPNAYTSPLPADGSHWVKEQLISGGVSVAYGERQQFMLNLSYFLQNTSSQSQLMTVPLPPDTAYQTVTIQSIRPEPDTITKTQDDNWIAHFTVLPNQDIDISASISIQTTLLPKTMSESKLSNPTTFLSAQKYWEVGDSRIQNLVQTYKTPEDIFNYVVATLSYDYRRVSLESERLGALRVLESPKTAICTEFTDLFITMARAAGIPARRAIGYAYTTNARLRPLSLISDVLHAWPEYYDTQRQLWIPVDPTWTDTTGGVDYFHKLDFNHIVFAYNGIQSEEPYPAGFYRNPKKESRDVDVSFQTEKSPLSQKNSIKTDIRFPKSITAGLTTIGNIRIKNTSGETVKKISVTIFSSLANILSQKEYTEILPFEAINIPIEIKSQNFFSKSQERITVTVNGDVVQYTFTVVPIYISLLPIGIGIGIAIVCSLLFFSMKKLWKPSKKK